METTRFLGVVAVGLTAAAVALVLAAVLDAPVLRLVAVALLVGVLLAKEVWTWRGSRSAWLATLLAVLAVGVVAFVAARIVA